MYVDEEDRPLYRTVRYNSPKRFAQERPDGRGGWFPNLGGVRRVPYRLPELLKASRTSATIYVVEGEKDADRLWSLHLPATTNAGGASWKWPDAWAWHFEGAFRVAVIADNDEPGRKAAAHRAAIIARSGAEVRLIEQLPDVVEHGDVSDFLDGGRSAEELGTLVTFARRVIGDDGGLGLVSIGDLLDEPDEEQDEVVQGLLIAGGTSLIVAKPKTGKSTFARCLALAVARGEVFLGRATRKSTAIYLAFEEKRTEVKRHFRQMGARRDDDLYVLIASSPPDAIERLRVEIGRRGPGLVILDPLQKFVRVEDINDYVKVTAAIEPLHSLARTTGAHLLFPHHAGKAGDRDAGDEVLGSTALFGGVDTLLRLRRTKQDVRFISSLQRYGSDLEETIISLDRETGGIELGDTRAAAERGRVAAAIIERLRGVEREPEANICDAVEARKSLTQGVLRDLLSAGT